MPDTPGWSRQDIDQVISSGERKDAKVAKPVPLYWVYVTAWATPDGVVQFREDIYNRDGIGGAVLAPAQPVTGKRARQALSPPWMLRLGRGPTPNDRLGARPPIWLSPAHTRT